MQAAHDGTGPSDARSAVPAGPRRRPDALDHDLDGGLATLVNEVEQEAEAKPVELVLPPAEKEQDGLERTPRDDDVLVRLPIPVVSQQPREFVCRRCHLVKHQCQLADGERMICRECVSEAGT